MSMSHKLASAVLASAMVVFATTPSRADITYDVNVQFPLVWTRLGVLPGTVSITGYIVTDGNLGPLTTSDVISYSVEFNPGVAAEDFFGPIPPPLHHSPPYWLTLFNPSRFRASWRLLPGCFWISAEVAVLALLRPIRSIACTAISALGVPRSPP